MTRPWQQLDAVDTPEGRLVLLQRGPGDFLITVGKRVLMNSQANRSELILAELTCKEVMKSGVSKPRLLIGGLGMACTLRAALDNLPPDAAITVAEINPVVLAWCQGPLSGLTQGAVADPRVQVTIQDVTQSIRQAAESKTKLHAIVLDLYQGPVEADKKAGRAFYGQKALETTRRALTNGGVFSVWGEDPDPAFDKRLREAGFSVTGQRPKIGGRRHMIWLATR